MLNCDTARFDGKNIALIYVGDNSGCSHVRLRYNAMYFDGIDTGVIPIVMPVFTFDPNILAHCKSIVFQRPVSPTHVEIVKRYRALQPKYGYKMVFELDDLIFKTGLGPADKEDGIPSYNMSSQRINLDAIQNVLKDVLPLMDLIVVSTDYLKKAFEKVFGVNNVMTIKNVVPRYLWNYPRKGDITEDLKKPRVIYSGSPTHYINPIPPRAPSPQEPQGFSGIAGKRGDWNTALCDWVIKNVREDKIDFICMGALPFFWEPIKDKIKFIPWANSQTFPRLFMEQMADFSIASIVDNEFNKCKSALRFTEACATGAVFIGTVFSANDDSPYREIHPECKYYDNWTVDQIDNMFWKLCKKEKFNEIRNWQYQQCNQADFWLESSKHMNDWMNMLDSKDTSQFI